MIIEMVRCEMCGRATALYPSERALLADFPRLTITCEQCVEATRKDPLYPERKRSHSAKSNSCWQSRQ
jgi:hypothetical protein